MNKLGRTPLLVVCVVVLLAPIGAAAQEHQPPTSPAAEGKTDAPPLEYKKETGEEHGAAEHHGLSALLWPTLNFAILAGALWWFLRTPLATYLKDRHTSIRRDLVEAAGLKASANEKLAEIDRKLQALPGEIENLKRRGGEEIAAEEQRIAAMAAAERERLLEQTRREIALQVRIAKRELVEHAADLAVQLATERIQHTISPEDQARLIERSLNELRTKN